MSKHEELRGIICAQHEQEPFSEILGVPLRNDLKRLKKIASGLSVQVFKMRGVVDIGVGALDHCWLQLNMPKPPEEKIIIDFLPVQNADYRELIEKFMAGDLSPAELTEAASGLPTTDRLIVGAPPQEARYYGELAFVQ